ncbi:MAG: hypothetical protein CMA48_00520 [Euryarchaeota archaeon]|nr:hypothetical protein [Euryarchaeota archaeon]
MNMNSVNNKYIKYFLIAFFSFSIIFSRSFYGLYFLDFRLGEIMVAISLVFYFYFMYKRKMFSDSYQKIIFILFGIFASFIISLILEEGYFFSNYLFKSSSYIWTISFMFLGIVYSLNKENFEHFSYAMSASLLILYLFFKNHPKFFVDFFLNNSDKFELAKASNMLISILFVNILNYHVISNKKFVNYYFIFSTSLFLPLMIFNSRGSFLSLCFFIILFLIYRKEIYSDSLINTTIFIAIFSLTFIISTYNIFGAFDFSKRTEQNQVEIGSISSNLNKLVKNKETISVFLSFYVYEGRLYSRDGTTDWRLDIWQDVVEDLNDRNKVLTGYGYSAIIPVMVDPEAPGRLGEDGLNENVHNYIFTILSRGGLIQLLLFTYLHFKIFVIYKKKNRNNFILVLMIPAFFNAFLDVAMESVQFPLMYYLLIGFLLSPKEYLKNNS